MSSISCPALGFCVVVDVGGNEVVDVAGVWSAPRNVDPGVPVGFGFTGVSCDSVAFCMATDVTGNVVEGSG
jgi:hypothetical protein